MESSEEELFHQDFRISLLVPHSNAVMSSRQNGDWDRTTAAAVQLLQSSVVSTDHFNIVL